MNLKRQNIILISLTILTMIFLPVYSSAIYSDYIWNSTNYLSIPTSSNISSEYTDDTSNPLNLECESAILIEQTTRSNPILIQFP